MMKMLVPSHAQISKRERNSLQQVSSQPMKSGTTPS